MCSANRNFTMDSGAEKIYFLFEKEEFCAKKCRQSPSAQNPEVESMIWHKAGTK